MIRWDKVGVFGDSQESRVRTRRGASWARSRVSPPPGILSEWARQPSLSPWLAATR